MTIIKQFFKKFSRKSTKIEMSSSTNQNFFNIFPLVFRRWFMMTISWCERVQTLCELSQALNRCYCFLIRVREKCITSHRFSFFFFHISIENSYFCHFLFIIFIHWNCTWLKCNSVFISLYFECVLTKKNIYFHFNIVVAHPLNIKKVQHLLFSSSVMLRFFTDPIERLNGKELNVSTFLELNCHNLVSKIRWRTQTKHGKFNEPNQNIYFNILRIEIFQFHMLTRHHTYHFSVFPWKSFFCMIETPSRGQWKLNCI